MAYKPEFNQVIDVTMPTEVFEDLYKRGHIANLAEKSFEVQEKFNAKHRPGADYCYTVIRVNGVDLVWLDPPIPMYNGGGTVEP